jgi:hypothetical protein
MPGGMRKLSMPHFGGVLPLARAIGSPDVRICFFPQLQPLVGHYTRVEDIRQPKIAGSDIFLRINCACGAFGLCRSKDFFIWRRKIAGKTFRKIGRGSF